MVYSFAGGSDGAVPYAGLTSVGSPYGTMYGTTLTGGASSLGTVFSISPDGTESVLHSFAGGSDGAAPTAGLVDVNGTLYGTTNEGGASNLGTVFEITTSGAESVLYSFAGGSDGANPFAGLIKVGGALYGTTRLGGGTNNDGTVFKVTLSGKESVLHSFTDGSDGAGPVAGLTKVGGTLYGTTNGGGASNLGTVFTITTSGTESVLYSFTGGSDGADPVAGLTKVGGALYGTTEYGGSSSAGTVFKVTTSGTESVLYSFGEGNLDGAEPTSGLVNVHGNLYGTTEHGGNRACNSGEGCGTIFALLKKGPEYVLYSFAGGSDGANPFAGLTDVNGVLYGTTLSGGASGQGTVYEFYP